MKIGGNFAFKKIQDESINMEFNYECATVEGVGIKTSILLGVTFFNNISNACIDFKFWLFTNIYVFYCNNFNNYFANYNKY